MTTSVKENREEVSAKVGSRVLKLTNLNKVFWPEEKYTKGDLIDYYRKISRTILPYLKDRPESLNRFPDGILGPNFFQKDFAHQPPDWVKTEKIFSESNQKTINYLVCNDQATLIYMANLGCIELNPWNSRIQKLDYPDFTIMDIDPGKVDFEDVIRTAQYIHRTLDEIKVPNYCKTSGARGLHICIPLGAKYTYDEAKEFTHLIAMLVNQKLPDITSIERSPSKRTRKIYLDYLQNRKAQTLAAPYCLRPKPGAPVSTPLEWSEVRSGLNPRDFNLKTIFKRLEKKGDLWKPVLGKGVDLRSAVEKLNKSLRP